MVNNKQFQWLNSQIDIWLKQELVDQKTVDEIQAYYKKKGIDDSNSPSILSYALVLLGTSLVLLGIILILAKNWAELPRLFRVFCSLVPLLTGISLGFYALIREKDKTWSEVAALIISMGILTALAINGQIYHVISNPPTLFLSTALLALPLVYIFSSQITGLFYFIMVGIYLVTTATGHYLSLGYFLLAGILLIGLIKPWLLLQYYRAKLIANNFWLLFTMSIVGFIFITALISYEVPVREIYTLYFFSLIMLNIYLFSSNSQVKSGNNNLFSTSSLTSPIASGQLHTLDILGKFGLYILIYVLSFRGVWKYLEKLPTDPLPLIILLAFYLGVFLISFIIYKRDQLIELPPIFLPLVILLLHYFSNLNNFAMISSLVFNLIFFALGIYFLFQGIKTNAIGIANQGLIFIVLLIATRFLDIEFSFLIRGIVFVLLGICFLVTNLWLVRKKKEVKNG